MIRPAKAAAVARFEFINVAKRWTYLLVTFGLPLFFSGLSAAILGVQGAFLEAKIEEKVIYGIVDHDGVLRDREIWQRFTELEEEAQESIITVGLQTTNRYFLMLESFVFARFEDDDSAVSALRSGRVGAVYAIEDGYLEEGSVLVYESSSGPMISVRGATVEPVLRDLLRDQLLREVVDESLRERVRHPMQLERNVATAEGELIPSEDRAIEIIVRAGVPFLLGVLLLTALLSSSGYLVQTVALDKESKVVEVLLSSADPDELLTGKLLGLGAAGLLQFLVWAFMVVGGGLALATLVASLDIPVPWEALSISPIFFVMGYLFIGSLMLATGSLGSSVPESQKLTLGWALLAVMPLMTMIVLLEEPHGSIGKLLTWIPFSAPLTVVVRLSIDPAGIAAWEIIGALGVLLASTWLSIRFGARLFRVGLLLTGTRPGFRELLRQARLLD